MALVPIISQSWDTTSVFTPTRMNNIEQNLAIVSDATGTKYSTGVSVKDKIDSMITDSPIAVTSGNVTDLAISGQHFVRNGVAYIYGAMRVNANISNMYICDLNVRVLGDVNWVGINRTTHQLIGGYISTNKLYCNEGVLNSGDLFLINVAFKVES